MGSTLYLLALFALGPSQESGTEEKEPPKKITIDFSTGYESLSEDLERSLRWKKLFGVFGVSEVHIFPTRESGPYLGPPIRIWGNGWGTSLWRDPVTGWSIQ